MEALEASICRFYSGTTNVGGRRLDAAHHILVLVSNKHARDNLRESPTGHPLVTAQRGKPLIDRHTNQRGGTGCHAPH